MSGLDEGTAQEREIEKLLVTRVAAASNSRCDGYYGG
jgi:hypothetical protein